MIDGISRKAFERFCKRKRIAFAALFGSAASGRTTAHSDLDLAFWLTGKRLDGRELELTNGLIQLFHRNDVDAVVLNHANPLLQWQVASTGRLLYEWELGRFHRFQIYAMKQHNDYQYRLASLRRELARRRQDTAEETLKTSFGFGGKNSALIIRKFEKTSP